jgi:hypothetical protein
MRVIDGFGDGGSVFSLVIWTLDLVVRPLDTSLGHPGVIVPAIPDLKDGIPLHERQRAEFIPLRIWIARVLLQTMWRWRQKVDPGTIICLPAANTVMRVLFSTADPTLLIMKSTMSLVLAIGLGLRVDINDTYIPNTQ